MTKTCRDCSHNAMCIYILSMEGEIRNHYPPVFPTRPDVKQCKLLRDWMDSFATICKYYDSLNGSVKNEKTV